jgi:glutathione S-transferase
MDHSIKTRRLKKYEAEHEACKTDGGNPATDFYSPFGPMIAKVRAPQALLDHINGFAEENVFAEQGREFIVPSEVCFDGGEASLASHTGGMIRRYIAGMENTRVSRVQFENFWIVSQYAGTPGPVHFHTGDICGVLYLKVPQIEDAEEARTYISGRHAGYINFPIGGKQRFSKSLISFKPAVGGLLCFPGLASARCGAFSRHGRKKVAGLQSLCLDRRLNASLEINSMITVHHLNNSRSQRILWLLEELGLEYGIKRYQRDAKTMLAPPELRQIQPLGKSPVITDGDLSLAESGAIIEYVVGRYGNGRLIPTAESPERLRYTYWLHYAEGSLQPLLLMKLIFDRIESTPMPFFARPIAKAISRNVKSSFIEPNIDRHLDYMEGELGKAAWFAGPEFTAADIQMSFPLEAAVARGGLDAKRPKLMAFLERIHARPAYRRAIERGGEYQLLK